MWVCRLIVDVNDPVFQALLECNGRSLCHECRDSSGSESQPCFPVLTRKNELYKVLVLSIHLLNLGIRSDRFVRFFEQCTPTAGEI